MRPGFKMALRLKAGVCPLVIGHSLAFAQTSPATGVIAENFNGQIIYDGTYNGTMSVPMRVPQNLSLGSLLGAAMNTKSQPYGGATHYEVEYNGNQVKGTWRQQGLFTGNGTFTGTRTGSTCNLVTNEGIQYTAECTTTRFFSRLAFTDGRGRKHKSVIDTNQTTLVDYAERDRLRLIESERARGCLCGGGAVRCPAQRRASVDQKI